MIIPNDQDIITAMVGNVFEDGYPEDLVNEYQVRLGMLSRSGAGVGGLGNMGIMQLLRDFEVRPKNAREYVEVKNWRNVENDTIVMFDGRRGLFKGASSDGMVLVKLDGQVIVQEVPGGRVQLPKQTVQDVPEEAFDGEPQQPNTPQMKVIESEKDEVDDAPSIDDMVFAMWSGVEAGTKVTITSTDGAIAGEYIDVEDGGQLAVSVDGELQFFPAASVVVAEQEKAEA